MARRGINKVILVGNLGKDPEVRYTPAGAAVANFTMATSESWKDQSGAQQERVEWHRIVAWNKLGEICGQYLRKGSHVYVEGSLRTRTWEDQNKIKRYTTEIIATELQMLDKKQDTAGEPDMAAEPGGSSAPPSTAAGNSGGDEIPF